MLARLAAALVLLLAAACQLAAAATAEQWRSQIIYFLLTDRFAPAPGATPGPCKLLDWNGGTWSGITHNLDVIQDLGMTSVWITPIPYQYEGKSWGHSGYHGYWAQDWGRVDPHYGTPEELTALIDAAHSRGMLMMLDVVANHASPTANVSAVTPFNAPSHYHGCGGCGEHCAIPQSAYAGAEAWPPQRAALQLVQTCRLVDLLDLNQTHPEVRAGLVSWLRRTLASFDFDAIRLDTVKHVAMDFWVDFTNAAPGLFSMGEVLHGDTRVMPQYLAAAGPDGRRPMSSLLNFPLYYKLTDVFARGADMRTLLGEVQLQRQLLGAGATPLLGTFLENHDFPRFLTLQRDVTLYKNALTWLLLAEGIPVVYYGAAAGLAGGMDDNSNRRCLWETPYVRQSELFRLIATLSKLRTSRQLWNVTERHANVTSHCYAYTVGPDTLVVTTNRGSGSASSSSPARSEQQTCDITLPEGSQLLRTGLPGLQDVLDAAQRTGAAPAGVAWDASTRTLQVATPGGSPRVLTGTRFSLNYLSESDKSDESDTDAAPSPRSSAGVARGESGDGSSARDGVRLAWGRAPQLTSSAAGRSGRGCAAAGRLVLLLLLLPLLLLGGWLR